MTANISQFKRTEAKVTVSTFGWNALSSFDARVAGTSIGGLKFFAALLQRGRTMTGKPLMGRVMASPGPCQDRISTV